MTDTAPRVSPWNVANYLTCLRLLLVPFFLAALLAREGEDAGLRLVAAVIFLVAMLTDRIDGQLARSRGLITSVGKILDPIADKALIGAALVGLSMLDELPWWVTVVVLIREIGVTLLRFVVIRHGVMHAGGGGKLKTVLQGVAITLYLLPLTGVLHTAAAVVMAAAVLLTLVTGVDIVVRALVLRTTSERADMKRQRRG